MDIVTAAQMQEIDRRAIEEYKIPGVVLMENAGLCLVEAINRLGCGPRIVVVAGKGNNGGDGFVVARHLSPHKNLTVWTTADTSEYRGDALINLNILHKLEIPCTNLRQDHALAALEAELAAADLVVDALLGTGVTREVDSFYADIIRLINKAPAPVLAVDIPSGISADTGQVLGEAVQADFTVTFALPKRGLLLFPGAGHAGRLEIADIGIPRPLLTGHGLAMLTKEQVASAMPGRSANTHKGTFGSALLIAGSRGMSGAATLSARAALRGGCGLVYAATPQSVQPMVASQVAEAITLPLPENEGGRLHASALPLLRERWQSCRSLAVGPGLAEDEETLWLLATILAECPLPVVLDAGALNLLAKKPQLMDGRKAPVILTPHPGEAARLLDTTVSQVESHRLQAARELCTAYRSTVVLKGAHTLVATENEAFLNVTGNSGMASAGSGDVLTGLLVSLLAQGMSTQKAACAAVYLHGLAADLAVENISKAALVAGDIIDHISLAYLQTEKIHM
ncbi:NAD(P)H-hydrate dehydratase [Dethiobacter alkaliphilus]|uniref:NAD(P)H-hydrate dehydratase n=1 Tax=Dethiobacter alkaliphilus TaxID=427926 RepID=UPI002226124C|nr:NAD(P)H-hydrate dehydratase [Dethiobacter alkaliphilus]MCW3490572.1 NAD(P)H-hydrate dehydratase [Dethiobacter alkaliphilus]